MPELTLPRGPSTTATRATGPTPSSSSTACSSTARCGEGRRRALPTSAASSRPAARLPREPMRGRRPLPRGVARLIAAFLEALELDDVTLVGNDTGGAICQLVVDRHPERLGRLVLTNCDAFENFPPKAFLAAGRAARVPPCSTRRCSRCDPPAAAHAVGLRHAHPAPSRTR